MTLVGQVYALWNQQVPVTGQKELYEAWWLLVSDLELQEALEALVVLSALDAYMPRPGTLRRKVIDRRGEPQPPSPIEAWAQLRAVTDRVNSGTFEPVAWHPAVAETIKRIGTNLHTNGDREQFIKLYEQICHKWQEELYTPKLP